MSLQTLRERTRPYLPEDQFGIVEDAYAFAAVQHDGQRRKSGEPYLVHPEQAALILADLRLDAKAIAAALLHDVPEDCGVPMTEIERRFGSEVSKLVDGVTKLGKATTMSTDTKSGRTIDESHQAENLRKMLIAMAEDIRVVLIKLADRLHNMRTLNALPRHRQLAIAQETMEIYAPLASRLGIWQLKWELEDLAFSYLHPEEYKSIASLVATRRESRESYINKVVSILKETLESNGIKADVSGRPKHIYSIYKKIQKYSAIGRDFEDIYDLLAVRVIVDTKSECYHALGVVHDLWHPMPNQFDDYIANPKESMYQSLHTTVMSLGGKPLEVQIRTQEMHRNAEYGIAAHWRYKEHGRGNGQFEERIAWLRQLMDWQNELRGAQEFVDSVKTDIFHDQVFVYTPMGEIKDLPAGSTPIDFAYRVHTDLGHRCVGAKVNGRLVPLNTALANGDIVEIITAKVGRGPSRDWLNSNLGYVRTHHAREKIRQWFKRQERAENIERGREQLERELKRLALQKPHDEIAKLFKYDRVEDFLVAIGCGEVNAGQIAIKIAALEPKPVVLPEITPKKHVTPKSGTFRVMGVGDLVTTLSKCCNPVPGDAVMGYVTRFRGVAIHRADCINILNVSEPARVVPVDWSNTRDQMYPVSIRLDAWDRVGLLRDVTAVVSEEKVNMSGVSSSANNDMTATIILNIEASGIEQLSRVLNKLEGVRGVINVVRDLPGRAEAKER